MELTDELKTLVLAGLAEIKEMLMALSGQAAASPGALPAAEVKAQVDAMHQMTHDLHAAVDKAGQPAPDAAAAA
jgi:hypothetical protein